jgi:hypothetical protein
MECARQMYICRSFHFTGHWCVEKCTVGFRIDSRTNKRDLLFVISYLVPLGEIKLEV